MTSDIRPGDLLFVSGKGFVSNVIQLGCLSVPNWGPLGRWGVAGFSHVAIVAPVFGEMIVYESTSFGRPRCVRTGRENPKGVQAHHLSTILDGGGDVWHCPLRRPLYLHEEERLLEFLEACLGREYDFFSAGRSGGGRLLRLIQRLTMREDLDEYYCSELVIRAHAVVGLHQCRNSSNWNPMRVYRNEVRKGIIERGQLIS